MAANDNPIIVDHAAIRDTSDFLRTLGASLTRGVTEIDGHMRILLGSWHGPAADVFHHGWDTVHHGARTVLDTLDDAARLLGVNAADFAATDTQNAHSTETIGSSLRL